MKTQEAFEAWVDSRIGEAYRAYCIWERENGPDNMKVWVDWQSEDFMRYVWSQTRKNRPVAETRAQIEHHGMWLMTQPRAIPPRSFPFLDHRTLKEVWRQEKTK